MRNDNVVDSSKVRRLDVMMMPGDDDSRNVLNGSKKYVITYAQYIEEISYALSLCLAVFSFRVILLTFGQS